MSDSGGDKKHSASERKRRQAREKGQIAKSQDLTSATLLLAAIGALYAIGGNMAAYLSGGIEQALGETKLAPMTNQDATQYMLQISQRLAMAAVPMMILMFIGGVLINVFQSGLLLSTDKLMPKLSNISPMSGAKRILSLQGVMRLVFGMFKVGIIGGIAYLALRAHHGDVISMASLSVPQLAKSMFDTLFGVSLWIGVGLFVLALLEYVYQWWKTEQDLMMTDQEVRDEMKDTEADPQVAARRRQVARQLAMGQLGSEVPKADVVASNPTELAIAIKYDPLTMPAPIVVAKGAGMIAQRIRRLALENGIPVVERKELAQALYKLVDVGQEVPAEQYQAVAEILRYVYQMQGKKVPQATAA
ncbi:EscU/YscU/HrcU family type III secretion system export apparatus switch protein [Rhodopirellula baltica]|uniref:Flagellar biosynthetic protein FlhB n=4 Tax=Rhodopirellula baltica TaxID=265606 RepID=Q7UXG2_RHOBA|nr:EscU/YscU/HrcU family type III secretion system export apparatus switch protein [Rhodopirellula baltica]EGF24338.1 flagellar biosynthetic protein FlhB [Rhodopirellula baltica WH47]EKK01640.1 flagellar biosynthetic protein FlhB [Rhodopirellula baltica SH28]ELP35608.1 flagellar biosynthetic protein FlhB [Rhodopirellula baltica SWK14]CAD72044.1 flagellar biosynthetic protein FlhB [Rhodopirellula baltica SH 1]HBE66373.1 flagellar type III secretion system protein FlhB [Rhodopirellula baltica]